MTETEILELRATAYTKSTCMISANVLQELCDLAVRTVRRETPKRLLFLKIQKCNRDLHQAIEKGQGMIPSAEKLSAIIAERDTYIAELRELT